MIFYSLSASKSTAIISSSSSSSPLTEIVPKNETKEEIKEEKSPKSKVAKSPKDSPPKESKKEAESSESTKEEQHQERQVRPKRNVRKPHLLGDELAVAVAVESSFKSARGKHSGGKRGGGTCGKSTVSSPASHYERGFSGGGRGGKRGTLNSRPISSSSSSHSGTPTVRSLLAAQQHRKLQHQQMLRRPRGRPKVMSPPGMSGPAHESSFPRPSRDVSSISNQQRTSSSGIARRGVGSSSSRGTFHSHGSTSSSSWNNGRGRSSNKDDDDDDDDFGLTLNIHHKRQISESLDQTKGQRTRQLMPRRAASVSLSSLQLQQQEQRIIASATSDSPPCSGSPAAMEMNEFFPEGASISDDATSKASNSPVSSKSASPCSPEMIEDRYEQLPAYRRLQYSLVLGDINQKFLNQSFHPL